MRKNTGKARQNVSYVFKFFNVLKLGTSNLDSRIIESVPLATPPQAVVISLAHNHTADLFISSYRGATVITFR